MKRTASRQIRIWPLWCLVVVCVLFSGCTASRYQKKTSAEKNSRDMTNASKEPAALYYDFSDVLIPGELRINRRESFVYESSGFVAGVLVLTGKMELSKLIAFFSSNMVKDNWEMISAIKSARTLMLFKKENRWCVVRILEKGMFSTEAEIWVTPDALGSGSGSGLLK